MLDVSVIIPVYNAAAFLEKAINSALSFDEVNEIVLIEDKSTDNSLEICQKLALRDPRIKLYQHPDKENHGAGASRNLGLEKAGGTFISFLDSDDYYLPNRFDAEKEIFKNEKIEGVFGAIGVEYLTEKGKKEFEEKFKNISLTTINFPAVGNTVFLGLLGLTPQIFGTFFHLNALTIRKSAVDKNNLRFNEKLRVHQDSDFIVKLAFHCYLKSGIIDKAIAIRGIHDNNRITKIIRYSPQYNERQLLLWTSLNDWAQKNTVSAAAQNKIYLSYKSFDLAVKSGLHKYFCIFSEALKNPAILKTKYRFTYLNR